MSSSFRYKERRNRTLADSLLGRKDACCKYNFEELTTLELELSNMYTELEKSLDNPFSALRMFLHNTPEAVRSLLDNCIVLLDGNSDIHSGADPESSDIVRLDGLKPFNTRSHSNKGLHIYA